MQHSEFMPHGICYLWKPELVWLHVIADSMIALAYYAIPPALVFLVYRARREARLLGTPVVVRGLPYEWIYLAFGLFIIACGTTHIMGVWNIWRPNYWVSGGVKVVTALASVATAVALPPLLPKAIALFREARLSELQHAQLSLLAAIVENSEDAILTKDLKGVITSWNAGAARLYGYSAEEAIGRSVAILLPPDLRNELPFILHRIAAGESISHQETVRLTRSGEPREVSLSISPVRDSTGRVIGASTIARDITERKRAAERERELIREIAARAEAEKMAEQSAALAAESARLYEDARAINRTKSEFLAVMSHELRTPLNAVLGYTDLLDAGVYGELTANQRKQLARINRNINHLRALIEQILIYTKLEAGKIEPRLQVVDSREILHEVYELIAPAAQARQLPVTIVVPKDLQLRTDPVYLRQILLNLMPNAVKFTPAGGIRLAAHPSGGRVRFEVEDTGIGIDSQHLEAIFKPFWQVGQGRDREIEGTGLGLTVAERLTKLLGGRLIVRSELSKGSTFIVELPIHI